MSDRHTISPDYQITQARKVKRLEAENARLRARQQWIKCSERMPEEDGEYVIYDDLFVTTARFGLFDGRRGFWGLDYQDEHEAAEITHWMPLPPAPKEEA